MEAFPGALNLLLKKEQILMLAAPGRPRQIIARPMNTPATPASASSRPVIAFPPELPVSARRAEIEAPLQKHQVIIVCCAFIKISLELTKAICCPRWRWRWGAAG